MYAIVGALSSVWIIIIGMLVRVAAAGVATYRNGDTSGFAIVAIRVEQPVNLV